VEQFDPVRANVNDQWVERITDARRQLRAPEQRAGLALVIARRTPELLRHLAQVEIEDDWQRMREPILELLPLTAGGGLLIADFFAQWYGWLCRRQEQEQQQRHKGAQAYNVALYVLIYTGDRERARRSVRMALVEDVLQGADIEHSLATWMLRALLHEPQSEVDALVQFVRHERDSSAGTAGAVPRGILWYPDQVLVKYLGANRAIRTTECDLFQPRLEALAILLRNLDDAADKGRALEDMAANLFASVNGFEVRSVRETTKSAEHDVVVRNLVTKDPIVAEFGHYILVECKNWKEPAGARVIRDLVSRVRNLDGHSGVLLSAEGVTEEPKERACADLEIVKAFHRDDVYVMVLTCKDLLKLAYYVRG